MKPRQGQFDEKAFTRLAEAFIQQARAGAFDDGVFPDLPEYMPVPESGDETLAYFYERRPTRRR